MAALLCLREWLENVRQELGSNPWPGVRHLHFDFSVEQSDAERHSPGRRRELDRIREQVPPYLSKTCRVTIDGYRFRFNLRLDSNVLRVGRRLEHAHRLSHDGNQVEMPAIELKLSGRNARHLE